MDGPWYFSSHWQYLAILIPIQRKTWFIGITICLSPKAVPVYTCYSGVIVDIPPFILKIVHNWMTISMVILDMKP